MRTHLNFLLILVSLGLFVSCKNDKQEENNTGIQLQPSPYKLYINEVNSTTSPDWMEIYNPGLSNVDLSNGKIYKASRQYFTIPSGTVVQSHQFIVIYFNDTAEAGGFSLAANSGYLSLYDSEGRKIDSLCYPGMPEGVSYGRWPDGSDSWQVNGFPSPAMSNNPSTNKPPLIYKFWITNNHPISIETLSVSAFFEDDHHLNSAWLRYMYDNVDTTVEMFAISCGNGYTTEIPPLPSGTHVRYYLFANDDSLLTSYFPANAPGHTFSYTVQ